ncbi:MAG TPA: D-aminoacyl-tRNA deacylase [Fimbriimonadaceae bacterium]|nr:D-aminoacyl-tRNA deacylase [Fimbriimonadaceae bacterium]
MRAVVQRVRSAQVEIDGDIVGSCGVGLLVLVAGAVSDTAESANKLADRVAGMRIFNDASGKMNLALADLPPSDDPQILVISNFTLFGDAWSGRRPSFTHSAPYDQGERLYEGFIAALRTLGVRVATGIFGADMQVSLVNDGPVTLIVDA